MVWGFIAKSCLDGTAVNSLLCLRALEVFLCNLNLQMSMVSLQNHPLKLVSVFLVGNEMVIQPVKIFSAVQEKKYIVSWQMQLPSKK